MMNKHLAEQNISTKSPEDSEKRIEKGSLRFSPFMNLDQFVLS